MTFGAWLAGLGGGRWGSRGRALLALVAVLALVGGCGTGSTSTSEFVFAGIGPAGGQAQAGPVLLTIPPGALQEETGVAVLPEWTLLPIQSPDGCTYSYVGPIYCCGPVGQGLLVDGVLRMGYDESLIPPGFTEADLVLLIWDNTNLVMVPRPVPPAIQDTVQNFFEDPAYGELGHVAIGLRDCTNASPFDLLVQQGGPPAQLGKPGDGSTAGTLNVALLYQADSADVLAPLVVPTEGLNFDGFVPSPNQQRVLFAVQDPSSGADTIHSARVDGSTPVDLLVGEDQANGVFLQTYDPMYGWLAQGAGDHMYYVQYVSPIQQEMVQPLGNNPPPEPTQRYEVWRRLGNGPDVATREHFTDAGSSFLDDLRQSLAGVHVSAYSFDFVDGFNFVDEVNVPGGTPASLDQVPPSDGPQPPRFMPGGEDLYTITNDATEVDRYTPAGAFVETLFRLSDYKISGQLVDFALAPDGESFAAVIDFFGKGIESVLLMGTLTDGPLASWSFFQQVSVREMVWHPQQTGVFLDLSGFPVGVFILRDSDGFFIDENSLETFGLNNVDVNRIDGRIVTVSASQIIRIGPSPNAATLPPGIYVWPSDGDSAGRVQIAPAGITDPRVARWRATWRHAAGRFSARVR